MLPNYLDEYNTIRNEITDLSNIIIKAYKLQLDGYIGRNIDQLSESKQMLKNVDAQANAIDNRIIKVFARFDPEAGVLRELMALLKTTNELTRIASSAKKYASNMKSRFEENVDLSGIDEYLVLIHKAAIKALEYATRLDDNVEKYEEDYKKTMIEESKTDDLYGVLEKEILTMVCQGEDLAIHYISILNIARKFERVADHAANIAKMYLFAKKGGSMEVY